MSAETEELDLRDVLCICAVLVAAGARDDVWIQRVCSAHASEVLTKLDVGHGLIGEVDHVARLALSDAWNDGHRSACDLTARPCFEVGHLQENPYGEGS